MSYLPWPPLPEPTPQSAIEAVVDVMRDVGGWALLNKGRWLVNRTSGHWAH
jgi:hypothetical protein